MRKSIIISALLIGAINAFAQSDFALTRGVPAIVYALPKTVLCFEIEVETTVQKPGVFYLYSQRYLATNQVVMEEKVSSSVKGITMTTRAVPDLNRRFAVEPILNGPLNNIVVDAQGILQGVNISVSPEQTPTKKQIQPNRQFAGPSTADLLPLTQEFMMAGSMAKMAEGAAKQIYDIRESRLNLLSGEMDHLPDGNALRTMLSGLDRKEKELTELFVGSTSKETKVYKVYFTPDKVVSNDVLFRLSTNRGVVSKDDLSGEPYFITISPEKFTFQEPDPRAKPIKAGLYTVLPATTTIAISDGVKNLLEKTLELPQFGELVSLPETMFRAPDVKVKVDTQTGRLLGVEK
jgi:hypothetical protein